MFLLDSNAWIAFLRKTQFTDHPAVAV